MNKEYIVYIVLCADDTLYTGITTNIERRVSEHNGLKQGGARYTKMRRPVRLVYHTTHINRSEATKEEVRIKQLSKKQKELLYTKNA